MLTAISCYFTDLLTSGYRKEVALQITDEDMWLASDDSLAVVD